MKNEFAIGILANDSEFLIYSGDFRFFSLRELKLENGMNFHALDQLKTKEYNRAALPNVLDYRSMIILSTFCGNELTSYQSEWPPRFDLIAEIIEQNFPFISIMTK